MVLIWSSRATVARAPQDSLEARGERGPVLRLPCPFCRKRNVLALRCSATASRPDGASHTTTTIISSLCCSESLKKGWYTIAVVSLLGHGLRVDEDLLVGDGSVRVVVDELQTRTAEGTHTRVEARRGGAYARSAASYPVCVRAGATPVCACGARSVSARSCRRAAQGRSSRCRADPSRGMR